MKLKSLLWVPLMLTVLTGCGTSSVRTSQSVSSLSQFKDLTNMDKITPDTKFDLTAVSNPQIFTSLPVLNSVGKTVSLSVKNNPILFIAYWCPHCQRTLRLLAQNYNSLSKKPTIVYVYFTSNETLKQARATAQAEMTHFKYPAKHVYFILHSTPYIKGIPDLIVNYQGTTYSFAGEHTLSTWKQALS